MLSLIELVSQVWNFLPRQLPQFAWVIQCLQVMVVLLVIMMPFIGGEDEAESEEKVSWLWVVTKEVVGFVMFLPYWNKNRKAASSVTLEPDPKPERNGNVSEPDAAMVIPSHKTTPYLSDRPSFMGVNLRQLEQKLNATDRELIHGELLWKVRAVLLAYKNHKKIKRMHKGLEQIETVFYLETFALTAQEIIKQRQAAFRQDNMQFSWQLGIDKLGSTLTWLGDAAEAMSDNQQEKEEYIRFFAKELVFPRIKEEIVNNHHTLTPEEEHQLRQAIIQQAQAAQDAQDEIFE